ncbi:hypothetical protein VTL71DRAFT_3908 [Oculimacula yallundae]|uniref:N-acetyltransferase domain-containing protein n=1 Tax=Oculimacula yallundae TaxID=86028 RepID=A0ABR4C4D6_9HELO
MAYTYKIHHLPTTSPDQDPTLLPFLAGKFASLRLSALTVSSSAFSSTFAIESLFTSSQWISRLRRPLLHTFVAVAYSPSTLPPDSQQQAQNETQTIGRGDWIGSLTLLGPFTSSEFDIPESGYSATDSEGIEIDDSSESKWQITAVYNSPLHRGQGVAKMLIQAAMDFAEKEGGKERTRVRIMIHPSNVVVKRLYEGLGFGDAGYCTLAEAYRSNGDEEMLPADGGGEYLFSSSFGARNGKRRGFVKYLLTRDSE